MKDDAIASMAMLGLVGLRVLAVSEYAGEVKQAVETTAEQGWCPSCRAQARPLSGLAAQLLRYLAS